MNVLIDESLPRYLKRMLHEHQCVTVQEMGWSGIKNGVLLARAEQQFAVFLTADKNLRYQQNLQGRALAIIVFPSNKLSVIKQLAPQIIAIVPTITLGMLIEL
ncbi:MAG TPA: DUF5615 family PIN-like protein [Roseiflexaceae bacterium]|jgi:hypothetical protein|nr:DUF5615 family PIN-like protein [Roseiflexaceae bacterium]